MKICVIIPAHNEASTLGGVVEVLKKKNLDVVVIDDGSSDQSALVAQEKGAHVLRNEKKSGKGFSLKRGFDFAIKNNYEAVVAMDGDGQHDPHDIDQFIKKARHFPKSVITGNRFTDTQGMPWVRYLTNRFMSWLISLASHQEIPDSQCGYRYISCSILKDIELHCKDFEIETEVLMKAAKKGHAIYYAPVKTIYQDEESKISPFKDTWRFFRYFLKEIMS